MPQRDAIGQSLQEWLRFAEELQELIPLGASTVVLQPARGERTATVTLQCSQNRTHCSNRMRLAFPVRALPTGGDSVSTDLRLCVLRIML